MTQSPFYITTPIYYVNDEAHIGHAYTTILADVLARYHRLFGSQTFLLTGVDEHGQKVEQAARKKGITPQAHCDQMAPKFQQLWGQLNIQYDDFIRTTEPRHKAVVTAILQKLWEGGHLYSHTYAGWYDITEERFLTEKEMEDGRVAKDSPTVSYLEEKNYFFRMSAFQDWLIDHIETHPAFIQPETRRNEILGFLRQPLGDLCISRPKSRLSWGIELPFDPDYVTYVWVDALFNYASVHLAQGGEAALTKWWPHSHHLIGKDILTTHAVYWPTLLKAAGYEPPKTILAHGWWLIDNSKMSKSKGNVIKPLDLIERYGVEPFRYFMVRDMALGQDSQFSEKALVERLNSDLANDFGNLLNRSMKLLKQYFQRVIPQPGPLGELEQELATLGTTTVQKVQELVAVFKLPNAIEETLQLIRRANKYLEQTEPWKTAKTDLVRTGTILYHVLEVLRLGATLLSPMIPHKVEQLLHQLGLGPDHLGLMWGTLPTGITTREAEVLFPRQEYKPEQEDIKMETPAAIAPGASVAPEGVALLDIEDFRKVELKVAQVIQAERVPKTDKLMCLQVELGEEKRQIIAGIAAYYEPDALIGKKIIVVANLKPAKLRGLESRGMLLAAKTDEAFSVLTVLNDVPSGATIS